MKTAPTVSPEGHVILMYTDGSPCGDKGDSKYSAKVHLICNRAILMVCVCMRACVHAFVRVVHTRCVFLRVIFTGLSTGFSSDHEETRRMYV